MLRKTTSVLAVAGALALGAVGPALAQTANPCAAQKPGAMKSVEPGTPKNPCAAKNPKAKKTGETKNPGAAKNPCAPKNPCAAKK